ncbi:aldehyde ferredoxin oxidoreductase C-terminal domain-containing protein, partial [Chloroflexota bacterium]
HEFEQKLLDDYYKYRGWNNDGVPTRETLDKLGLSYVAEDFKQRGILTNKEDVPAKEPSVMKEKD